MENPGAVLDEAVLSAGCRSGLGEKKSKLELQTDLHSTLISAIEHLSAFKNAFLGDQFSYF